MIRDDAKTHRYGSGINGCVVRQKIAPGHKTKKAPSDSLNLTGLCISSSLESLTKSTCLALGLAQWLELAQFLLLVAFRRQRLDLHLL